GIDDEHTPRRIAGVLDRAQGRSTRLAAVQTLARARGPARVVSTAILGERLRLSSSPRTTEEAEIAITLARGLLAIAPDRSAAERTIAETSKTWPAELRARAK